MSLHDHSLFKLRHISRDLARAKRWVVRRDERTAHEKRRARRMERHAVKRLDRLGY